MKRSKQKPEDREKIFALADVFADAVWHEFVAGIRSASAKPKKSPKAHTAEAKKGHRIH